MTVEGNGGSSTYIGGVEIDGKLLVNSSVYNTWDTSQNWSDGAVFSPGSSFTAGSAQNVFDGNTSTQANPGGTDGTMTITFNGLSSASTVRLYANYASGVVANSNTKINGADVAATTNYGWSTYDVSGTGLQSIEVGKAGAKSTSLRAIEVDGKILVDSGAGTFDTLYQTWSQWVIQTLRTASAEAAALKSMLRSHAQTYSIGEDYCEGTVITAFGELWIAINDSPSTTFADLPALLTHPNWEKLGINA